MASGRLVPGRGRSAVAVAAAALLVTPWLAGCGEVQPGTAGSVDGERISMDRVDELARSVCAAEVTYAEITQGDYQPTPTSDSRENVLTVLVNEELAEQAAAELGLSVSAAESTPPDNTELNRLYEALDADDEAAFRDYFDSFSRLQALLRVIGEDQGDVPPSDDQAAIDAAVAAGREFLVGYAEDHDVELDPRFGDFNGGQVIGGSGSLSVPVGESEGSPRGEEPDVSELPDSQICQ